MNTYIIIINNCVVFLKSHKYWPPPSYFLVLFIISNGHNQTKRLSHQRHLHLVDEAIPFHYTRLYLEAPAGKEEGDKTE